jgi:hypothetical protein
MTRRLLAAALTIGALVSGCSLGNDPSRPAQLGGGSGRGSATKSGFPLAATRNTVRVGGGDAAADAAGVAGAVFPATDRSTRPDAVVLVDKGSWQDAITASVLAGNPIGAPLLVANGGHLPGASSDALHNLRPKGSDLSQDAQVIRIGTGVARPSGYRTAVIEGADPYARGAAIDRFFSAARGRPSSDVVVTSGERPDWAMPAAAWAARSGDAVLLTKRDSVPAPTLKALRQHARPNIYLLGPPAAISTRVERQLGRLGTVRRIQGPTPVENAIAFARYHRGGFGWGVVVPGYNFTLASTSRPLDAGAAASLAARGVFAPLLLTDQARALPRPLETYFLSVEPGYEGDPGQAVYNRVWLLGDAGTISVAAQSRLDQITELIPVQSNAP